MRSRMAEQAASGPRRSKLPIDPRWLVRGLCVACLLLGAVQPTTASEVFWTNWTTASGVGPMGSASGVITLPDTSMISVGYTGEINPAAQTMGGHQLLDPKHPLPQRPGGQRAP
jgi:hypothetical protein